MAARPPFLAVCGHTNIDVQLHVKELPKAGQSVPVLDRRTVWGGTAANIIPEVSMVEILFLSPILVGVAIAISALTGWGLEDLQKRIGAALRQDDKVVEVRVPSGDGSRIAWLHARGEVIDQNRVQLGGGPVEGAAQVRLALGQLGQALLAPLDGIVGEIAVAIGSQVAEGGVVMRIEPAPEPA